MLIGGEFDLHCTNAIVTKKGEEIMATILVCYAYLANQSINHMRFCVTPPICSNNEKEPGINTCTQPT